VRRRSSGRRRQNGTATSFWGRPDAATTAPQPVHPSDDPTAVVTSLGPPPLAGQELAAAHYFDAVYAKAVGGAVALATAAGILDTGEEEPGAVGHGATREDTGVGEPQSVSDGAT
jgi:hypothetical protein